MKNQKRLGKRDNAEPNEPMNAGQSNASFQDDGQDGGKRKQQGPMSRRTREFRGERRIGTDEVKKASGRSENQGETDNWDGTGGNSW